MIARWFRFCRLNRLALSILMLVAVAALPARADDWPKPADWDRKYPFDGPHHAHFYWLGSVRAALLKLVGAQFYRQVILEWTVFSPIIATGDTMYVEGCKPHGCDTNSVGTLVQGRNISVCVYYYSIPMPSEPVPEAAKASYPPPYAVRLWYMADTGSPLIERNPDDWDGCDFQSVEHAKAMFRNARAKAE